MDIERLATSAIINSVSKTDILSPFINDGDKEPSWDGNIYIYSNRNKSKDGIKKVPVQVKGVTRKQVPPKKVPKFSASVVDLDNWKNDGGIILFVVLIDETGEKSAIYYSSLLPVKINNLKQRSKGKQSISIPLRIFPDNNEQKVSVLLNFYENMKKQTSFAKASLVSSDKLMSDGVLENISFTVTAYGDKQKHDWQSILFQDDVYMYANIKGSAIPQPLPELPIDLHIGTTIDGDVCVGDTTYYNYYTVVRSYEGNTIKIGKSIIIKLNPEEKRFTIKYKLAGTLDDYCVDTECFIAIMEQKQVTINACLFPLSGLPDTDIEPCKQRLGYFRDVKTMLNKLGIVKPLDCSALSKADEDKIRSFTNSVVYGTPLHFSGRDEEFIYGKVDIANLNILIWAKRVSPGNYKIESFFGDHDIVLFKDNDTINSEPHSITHYALLSEKDILSAANLDYQKIADDLEKNDDSSLVTEKITLFVLEMLKAYDSKEEKDEQLLDLAEIYCKWLADQENIDKEIAFLNQMQIVKRRRKLEVDELVSLAILRSDQHNLAVRCGANILLDKQADAQACFDAMPKEEQKNFIQYPICHFGGLIYSESD